VADALSGTFLGPAAPGAVIGPVVVAPAAFKGALSASGAARAIAAGIQRAAPGAEVRLVPVADGGEGTLDALVTARGGRRRATAVADPLGRPVEAAIGELPGHICVIELAQASGYERVGSDERDPERTSTYGTGQQLRMALDLGAERIILGLGGSATNDGGMGLVRALGVRFLDADGRELAGIGADLGRVCAIDASGRDPRLEDVEILVACDVTNPLHGPDGAAIVFGPQKGADPAAVRRLDAGLVNFSEVIADATGIDIAGLPGAGAAGGAAGGIVALLGGTLTAGAALVLDAAGLSDQLAGAELCITGEGRLDGQSMHGKAVSAVAAAARDAGVACIAVAGALELLPGMVRRMGLTAAFPINRALASEPDALAATETNLAAMGAALAGFWGRARSGPAIG
jgi:glycerate 2-kinase